MIASRSSEPISPLSAGAVRVALWGAFYAAILLAWLAVVRMSLVQPWAGFSHLPAEHWAGHGMSAGEADPLALYTMWALMSVAMMLPTFVPALRTYVDLSATGATDARGAVALVSGYALVWLAASGIGAAAQFGLSRVSLLAPTGASLSPWLTAGLLFLAGAYQFSSFKEACLSKCRLPLTFFMERWRPGAATALRMGAELGALCLGCCWALMALGFVGGTMNLHWMGAATLFMTFEKLPDIGRHLTRPAGVLMMLAGCCVVLGPLGLS